MRPPRLFFSTLWGLCKPHRVLLPVYLIRDEVSKVWWVTVGETTEAESIAAVAGTAPATTCIAHAIWPRRHRARRLDAAKIEKC